MRCSWTTVLAVCIALGAAPAARAQFTFDDIEYWVGGGDNQAALVIDWVSGNDPLCLAWGYRWEGEATGEDMLMAIAGAGDVRSENNGPVIGSVDGDDPRLGAQITAYSFGNAVFGLGYDVDNDGGFVYVNGPNETGHAADADDNYHEGFLNGYWSYWQGSGNPYDGGSWGVATVGMGDRTLATGDWDGWSWNATGAWPSEPEPGVPVAAPVPEPATMALAALGMLFAALWRRKR